MTAVTRKRKQTPQMPELSVYDSQMSQISQLPRRQQLAINARAANKYIY